MMKMRMKRKMMMMQKKMIRKRKKDDEEEVFPNIASVIFLFLGKPVLGTH